MSFSAACREAQRKSATKHGLYKLPEYAVYLAMCNRCHNPNDAGYEFYGGRGIQVCERWRASPQAFLDDMRRRPTPAHQLERKENNGNYEPGNCEWVTRDIQYSNRRSNRKITYQDRTQTAKQWSKELGIPYERLLWRIKHGMSVELAFTLPKQNNGGRKTA